MQSASALIAPRYQQHPSCWKTATWLYLTVTTNANFTNGLWDPLNIIYSTVIAIYWDLHKITCCPIKQVAILESHSGITLFGYQGLFEAELHFPFQQEPCRAEQNTNVFFFFFCPVSATKIFNTASASACKSCCQWWLCFAPHIVSICLGQLSESNSIMMKTKLSQKYISNPIPWTQSPLGLPGVNRRLLQVWSLLCLMSTPLPYLSSVPIHPFSSSTLRCYWGLSGPYAEAQSCRLPPQW